MLPLSLFLLQNQPAAQNPLGMLFPVLLMIGIFYLLLFRPMQRQRKAQQKMISELQAGVTVVTSGGIIGTITEMKDNDTLILRVKPDGVKLQLARSAVSGLIEPQEAREAKK